MKNWVTRNSSDYLYVNLDWVESTEELSDTHVRFHMHNGKIIIFPKKCFYEGRKELLINVLGGTTDYELGKPQREEAADGR